jgi:hypothetical protein
MTSREDGVVRKWKGAVANYIEGWLMRKRDASGIDCFLDFDQYVSEHDSLVDLYTAQAAEVRRCARIREALRQMLDAFGHVHTDRQEAWDAVSAALAALNSEPADE